MTNQCRWSFSFLLWLTNARLVRIAFVSVQTQWTLRVGITLHLQLVLFECIIAPTVFIIYTFRVKTYPWLYCFVDLDVRNLLGDFGNIFFLSLWLQCTFKFVVKHIFCEVIMRLLKPWLALLITWANILLSLIFVFFNAYDWRLDVLVHVSRSKTSVTVHSCERWFSLIH